MLDTANRRHWAQESPNRASHRSCPEKKKKNKMERDGRRPDIRLPWLCCSTDRCDSVLEVKTEPLGFPDRSVFSYLRGRFKATRYEAPPTGREETFTAVKTCRWSSASCSSHA